MLTSELIPAANPGSRKLLVVLHGLGDSMAGWRWLPEALGLPDLNYLLVNAPDEYFGGYSWYDFSGDSGTGIRRSRRMLEEFLAVQRQRGFRPDQTVLLGFSQGCLMTADVGFRHAERFAALVGISGYVWEPEELLRELSPVARDQRMLFTHGTRDPLIPCRDVQHQVESLQSAGLAIEWREFNKVHTIAGEPELAIIRQFLVRNLSKGVGSQ